jgi:hypothetical protein
LPPFSWSRTHSRRCWWKMSATFRPQAAEMRAGTWHPHPQDGVPWSAGRAPAAELHAIVRRTPAPPRQGDLASARLLANICRDGRHTRAKFMSAFPHRPDGGAASPKTPASSHRSISNKGCEQKVVTRSPRQHGREALAADPGSRHGRGRPQGPSRADRMPCLLRDVPKPKSM